MFVSHFLEWTRQRRGRVPILLATTVWLLASGVGTAEEPRGELALATADQTLSGEYKIDGSVILFSGEVLSDGRVVVDLKTNGLVFDGEYDPNDEDGPIFYFDGHDVSLMTEDKLALQALSLRLEKEWQGPGSGPLTVQRNWILRTVMLVAEAPAGFILKKREIRAPTSTVAPPTHRRERQPPSLDSFSDPKARRFQAFVEAAPIALGDVLDAL